MCAHAGAAGQGKMWLTILIDRSSYYSWCPVPAKPTRHCSNLANTDGPQQTCIVTLMNTRNSTQHNPTIGFSRLHDHIR